jgi:hypothetical protein
MQHDYILIRSYSILQNKFSILDDFGSFIWTHFLCSVLDQIMILVANIITKFTQTISYTIKKISFKIRVT